MKNFFINNRKYYACYNTTEGFIKRYNEDRICIVENIPPKKGYKDQWPSI